MLYTLCIQIQYNTAVHHIQDSSTACMHDRRYSHYVELPRHAARHRVHSKLHLLALLAQMQRDVRHHRARLRHGQPVARHDHDLLGVAQDLGGAGGVDLSVHAHLLCVAGVKLGTM